MSRCLVPGFITENIKNSTYDGNFMGCALFADLSGFTTLTESLMKHQKQGAEVLTEILNRIFGPLVECIYTHDGFITNFMGDAFIAIFPDRIKYDSIGKCYTALLKIINFIKDQGNVSSSFGKFGISIKCGFSHGTIEWGIIGNDNLNTYFFNGMAIDNCLKCQSLAFQNEVICDASTVRRNKNLNFISKGDFFIMAGELMEEGYAKMDIPVPGIEEQSAFIPNNILFFKDDAEFRSTANLFINFQPESLGELRDFTKLVLDLSAKYQGYFNKLDYSDKGWVILIIFGAPISFENNALPAADLVTELKGLEKKIKWRAGITTGTVYAGFIGQDIRCEYTVIGNTVNLAARLMTRADSNIIYCDNNTSIALKKHYSFKPAREVVLKGFNKSIQIYALLNKITGTTEYLSTFVGRNKELRTLKNILTTLPKNENVMLVEITGDAGIGKSRLFKEACKKFKDEYYLFSFNNCEVLATPFYSILFFFKNYFNIKENRSQKENYRSFMDVFNAMASELNIPKENLYYMKDTLTYALGISGNKSLSSSLSPQIIYKNQVSVFKELVYYHSLLSPVVICVENFQWIDDDSLHAINQIIKDNVPRTALFILTRKNDDKTSKILPALEKPEKIQLSPLTVQDSENIFKEITEKTKLNKDNYDSLWKKITGMADNNPYYVEQCSVFVNENIDKIIDGESFVLPPTINSIILSRFDRLSNDIKEILKTASVIGKEFTLLLLNEILKCSNPDKIHSNLDHLLEVTIREAFISRIDELFYMFSHGLTANAIYDMQLLSKLNQMHLWTARSMEKIFKKKIKSFYYDLYYHYSKAEDSNNALKYLILSAEYAKSRFFNNDAIRFYQKLYEHYTVIENDQGRSSALEAIYGIYKATGNYQKAYETIDLLAKIPSFGDRNQYMSQVRRGFLLRMESNYEKANAVLQDILKEKDKIKDQEIVYEIYNGLANVHYYTGKYEQARHFYLLAEEISLKLNLKQGLAIIYGNLAGVCWYKGELERSMEYFMKEMEIKKEFKDKTGIAICCGNMGNFFLNQGKYEKALKNFKIFYKHSLKAGWLEGLSISSGNIGIIYDIMEKYKLAIKYYLKQLNIASKLNNLAEISRAYGNLGISYTNMCDYEKALEYILKQKKLKEDIKDLRGLGYAYENLIRVYRITGKYQKVKESINALHAVTLEIEDHSSKANAIYLKSMYFYDLEHYSKALEIIEKAEAICDEHKLYHQLIDMLNYKADILIKTGEFSKARINQKKVEEIARISENSIGDFKNRWLELLLDFYLKANTSTKELEDYLNQKLSDSSKIVLLMDLIKLKYDYGLQFEDNKKEALKILRRLSKKDRNVKYHKYKKYLSILTA